jgi:hypothetical protein
MVLPSTTFAGNGLFRKITQPDTTTYVQFKGLVMDNISGEPLTFASISVSSTNIATVCNSEGEFILKVPKSMTDKQISVSYIGYKTKELPIADLKEKNHIRLDLITVSLAEINVFPQDPNYLIRAVMSKRTQNYQNTAELMTAFYRETIKKGWTYVSLSEAVIEVLKQPYDGSRPDMVRLFKGRKNADYGKLDTLTFKLMGGPYSTLMLDIMKNPYLTFTDDMLAYYNFTLNTITRINDKLIYVLEFKQKPEVTEPMFFGKLYIDSESLAITSAAYSMNVSNRVEAAQMFIRKKPAGADIYPTEATYLVNYREKDGKWYYGYSRGQINFKVNWTKKFFNTNINTTIEMAATDWIRTDEKTFKGSEKMKQNIIMEDAVSGFADKEFWGEYNVIEPEQSIEQAIRKIQKKIAK